MQFLTPNLSRSTFCQRTRQSDAPPLPAHTERARQTRARGRAHGELLLKVPHVHHHAAEVRRQIDNHVPWLARKHDPVRLEVRGQERDFVLIVALERPRPFGEVRVLGPRLRTGARKATSPSGPKSTQAKLPRARQSRPVAPHSTRARTAPRPVNTNDWVRSSGRTLAATQGGAGSVQLGVLS